MNSKRFQTQLLIVTEHSQWGVGLGISSGRWRDDDDEEEEEKDENTYEDRETTNASVSEVTMSKSVGPESPMILFNVVS